MKLKFLASVFFVLGFTFWPLTIAKADPNGLKVEVYTFDPSATPDRMAYTLCESGWTSVANIDSDFDNDNAGIVAGCQGDFVLVHYSGYITSPRSGLVSFTNWSDDGFYMSFDDVPVIDAWTLKGCSPTTAVVGMTAYASVKFDAWFYEFGGGACNRLFWSQDDGTVIVPPSAFSSDVVSPPVVVTPKLNKPFLLEGVVDGTNVDLTWSRFIEETPIERYAVTWTYGGADGWGVASVEPAITIGGLPEDTDVTFRVRADNDSLGVYSEYSDPITVRTGFDPVVETPIVEPEPTEPPVIPEPPIEPEPPVVVPEPPVEPETPEISPETPLEPVSTPEPIPTPETPLEPVDEPVTYPVVLTPEEQYQVMLDDLMATAQEDDIQVPEELASIPVLGASIVALTDALNFMGNVGADMSPAVRERAEKEIVAAIVLTQISQFATSQAVASAQASASAGASGSGSTTRRKN
jgi:hypothetical protein